MPPRGDGAERDGRARLAGKPAAGSPAPPVSPRAPTLALGRLQDAACARPLWFFAPSSRLGLSTERLLFERKKNNKIELLVGVRVYVVLLFIFLFYCGGHVVFRRCSYCPGYPREVSLYWEARD